MCKIFRHLLCQKISACDFFFSKFSMIKEGSFFSSLGVTAMNETGIEFVQKCLEGIEKRGIITS